MLDDLVDQCRDELDALFSGKTDELAYSGQSGFSSQPNFSRHDVNQYHNKHILIALSGGPDSMALVHFMARHRDFLGLDTIYAVIVDHGIRAESADEAALVARRLRGLDHVSPHILQIDQAAPDTRLQEWARMRRYELLYQFAKDNNIRIICTGHHMDDQAETILFRLAKGSGLDGLGAMARFNRIEASAFADDQGKVRQNPCSLYHYRPFLDVPKQDLIDLCNRTEIPYVQDPSNEKTQFARVRLRQSYDILAGEGLTAKRLAVTSMRMRRARQALDIYQRRFLNDPANFVEEFDLEKSSDALILYDKICGEPMEIRLRILTQLIKHISPDLSAQDYGPRVEKLERLERDLFPPIHRHHDNVMNKPIKRSLAGCDICVFIQDGHKILSIKS